MSIIFGLELSDGVGEGEDSSPPVEALLSCCNDMLMVAIKRRRLVIVIP